RLTVVSVVHAPLGRATGEPDILDAQSAFRVSRRKTGIPQLDPRNLRLTVIGSSGCSGAERDLSGGRIDALRTERAIEGMIILIKIEPKCQRLNEILERVNVALFQRAPPLD